MKKEEKSFYIPVLDGWRAISILLVLVYHGAWFKFGPENADYNYEHWKFFKIGLYGVNTFFAISGYLITSRILEEYKKFGSFNLKDFYIKRFFRIIPPFYFFLFVIFLLNTSLTLGTSWLDLFSSLTFTRIYQLHTLDWYTAHVWSLCVEEHFYIILSAYFYFFHKGKTRVVVTASLILIALWNMISFRFKDDPGLSLLRDYLKVFGWMDYMFAGTMLAYFTEDFQSWRLKLKSLQPLLFVFFFILMIVQFPLKTLLMPLYTAALIYFTTTSPHSWLLFLLESAPLKFIGKISYSLYLWQQLFFVPKNFLNEQLAFLQSFPVNLVCIFLTAWLSYQFIEKPFIKLGKKYLTHSL